MGSGINELLLIKKIYIFGFIFIVSWNEGVSVFFLIFELIFFFFISIGDDHKAYDDDDAILFFILKTVNRMLKEIFAVMILYCVRSFYEFIVFFFCFLRMLQCSHQDQNRSVSCLMINFLFLLQCIMYMTVGGVWISMWCNL